MTLTNDAAVALAADARQAAYFRAELDEQRQYLVDKVAQRRALIDRRSHTGGLRAQVHDAETEVRRLGRMIAQIDRRFGAVISVLDEQSAPEA